MPVINGIKYACEPCMRGHRSSKCSHRDRILVRVRKPGRPLSSCPHQAGSCTCGGIRVAIPKVQACGCGPGDDREEISEESETPQSILPPAEVRPSVSSSLPNVRVQKSKKKAQAPISASIADAILNDVLQDDTEPLKYESEPQLINPNSFAAQNGWNRIAPHPGEFQQDLRLYQHQAPNGGLQAGQPGLNRITEFADHSLKHFPQVPNPTDLRVSQMSIHPENGTAFHNSFYGESVNSVRRQSAGSSTASALLPHLQVIPEAVVSLPVKSCCRPETTVPARSQVQHRAISSQSPSVTQTLSGLSTRDTGSDRLHSFGVQALYEGPFQTSQYSSQGYQSSMQNISTFANPLTPAELAFLQSNVHLLSQKSEGQFEQPNLKFTSIDDALGHSCGCGDSCNCLGCASHPFNDRTITFVRSVKDIMGSDPAALSNLRRASVSEAQGQVISSCCGGQTQQISTSSNLKHTDQGPIPQSPRSVSSTRSSNPKVVQQSPSSSDADRQEGESGPAISPSDFFHIDYPLGICAENVDGCMCGDGCSCLGCLTHGGHDGVTLEHFQNPIVESGSGIIAGPSTAEERPTPATHTSSFDSFQSPYSSRY